MADYFLIESRSPFDSPEVKNNYQLASDLANAGHNVTLFLIENGVLALRPNPSSETLNQLGKVTLLADQFSLQERGIETAEIGYGAKNSSPEAIVDAMAEGAKMIWF
jgi:sulfur relay (sulfurtransferase) DsrF/TusC family protein